MGSVYESLLELHPDLNLEAATFELKPAAGHERKTTGSYYTPSPLVQCLLDSALDPVLNQAASGSNAQEAIFNLKVCDPACGSGHFLIAAAHRIAERRPEIAAAPNAAGRRKLIAALATEDPALYAAWLGDSRNAEGESHFVRNSGRYPLCGRGDINTYAIFAETNRMIVAPTGRVGCIVPSGIATDDTTKFFFQDLMDTRTVASLYDFENARGIFPGVHRSYKFCLLTIAGSADPIESSAEFAFFLHDPDDLRDSDVRFHLSAADIALLNPNTRTCPVFRSKRDAELTKAIYRRVPVLIKEGPPEENPWGVSFLRMFDMSNDSGLFRTRAQLEAGGWQLDGNVFRRDGAEYLPLYEAKMIHHFDHRFGDYADRAEGSESTALPAVPVERVQDPDYAVLPRYWVPAAEVEDRLRDKWDRGWLLGWRDICRSTDERTVIAAVVPRVGCGDTLLLMFPTLAPVMAALAAASLDTFAGDYCARQKIGGTHMKYHVFKQLPVPSAEQYNTLALWKTTGWDCLLALVLERTYTAVGLESFARDCGYHGPPFCWNEERRFLLRCELDAAFFHLYLPSQAYGEWLAASGETAEQLAALKDHFPTPRNAVEYILETFPIVKRKDIQQHGDYRTKLVILDIYDRMQHAIETGKPYQTLLDPPPPTRASRTRGKSTRITW